MPPFAAESARSRTAQAAWERLPVRKRLRPVREFRHLLVERADDLTAAVEADVKRPPDEVLATDVLSSAAACKFLLKRAERILRPRRVGDRPLWLFDTRDTVHRRPYGLVGLIGTWNYPIFLNAVPLLHALVAGNGVLWKPSEYGATSAAVLFEMLRQSGVPDGLVQLLPATREAGPQLAEADVDLVHFTGSDAVGRKLAARLGERLVPSILELSGVDAVVVMADADPVLAARAVWYGATFNGGQTCLAIRRTFVDRRIYEPFVATLRPLVESGGAVQLVTEGQARQARRLIDEARAAGCEIVQPLPPTPFPGKGGGESPSPPRAGVGEGLLPPTAILSPNASLGLCSEAAFAPLTAVIPFEATDEVIRDNNSCPFGLGAAVFTSDVERGKEFAAQLRTGMVVVNDVIAPTAHPATPFGGRGSSGWGVTQGEEGLLAMTVPQVVSVRRGSFRPHVDAILDPNPATADVTRGLLRSSHARTLRERWRGLRQMIRGMIRSRK